MPTTEPAGIRNNNYLNVKNTSDPWLDAGGRKSRTDSRGHAVFSDPAWGVRAGILQLRAYYIRHRLRTIAAILSRWAPSTDTIGSLPGAPPNSPEEYSRFVATQMEIEFNRPLELFHDAGTVANLGQLKDLFCAMAEFEIGSGFKVPASHFRAGMELVEPGIMGADGTEGHVTETVLVEENLTVETSPWHIGASVGSWKKGAVNDRDDVATIQRMLRNAAMVLSEPSVDPGEVDGKVLRDEPSSDTIQAIRSFQGRFFANPDGLIEVGGRTWRELSFVIEHGPAISEEHVPPAIALEDSFFPFSSLPSADWTTRPRSFGAPRDNGARAHAGCDLYFPTGTTIHALKAGRVVRGPYFFYADTYALEIDHGDFLARYGEVQRETLVSSGDEVFPGQPIAKVGKLQGISVPSNMLHLELYDKSASGPLTVAAAQSARTNRGVPYLRRRDLIDPTPFLNEHRNRLAPTQRVLRSARIAAERPAAISVGFTIRLTRVRQERRSGNAPRTIGEYECLWNGHQIPGFSGQMVEPGGPGDNTFAGVNHQSRIAAGTYRLGIHLGSRYKTEGYAEGTRFPRPGILLHDTGQRSAILIHPGANYINSIGCLNPASDLMNSSSNIGLADSHRRVVAIIDEIAARIGAAFPRTGVIPDATIVIREDM